ncbi:MAG: SIR2 family protein [Patescibacteria group bacterium]|nr:SIR2 family protein [Patescibacteria group bacterium]
MNLDLDKAIQEFQGILKKHPVLVVGTGASCALDQRFGMPELGKELRRMDQPDGGAEAEQWERVLASLDGGKGLEEALDAVTDTGLKERIVKATGAFVASVDRRWAWRVATGEATAPLHGLLRKLVDGLPPTNPIQHIVTPNYDMLIEHTCDALGVPWTDGFTTGSTCRLDWGAARNSMLKRTREPRGRSWTDTTRFMRHVQLHKVHGSINWFRNADETLLRCDRMIDGNPPEGWRRAMITPGGRKLQEAGKNREWFAEADAAIAGASAFLIVGYGFNDDHIHKGIQKRLVDQNCSGIVVTRDWSERFGDWIRRSSDLWAVCQNPDGGKPGTIVVGSENVGAPLVCEGKLWNITAFVETVMGD